MAILQAIILGIVQGISEFLPISSDGHLILIRKIFGFSDQGLNFDILLHLGTLVAVIIYFWRDWMEILKNLRQKENFLGQIILATLPAAMAGLALKNTVETFFRSIIWTAIFFIICGLFFIFAEKFYRINKDLGKITWRDSLFIGFLQIFALLPGISRSGSTIAAGMLRGLKREEAAKFSFLMAALIIAGSGFFGIIDSLKSGSLNSLVSESIVGFIVAAAVGYFSIAFLMKFLKKHKLYGFAGYLIVLGIALLFINGLTN